MTQPLPGFVSVVLDELTDDPVAVAFRAAAAKDQSAAEQVKAAMALAVEATQAEVERLWGLVPPEAAAAMRVELGEDGEVDPTTLSVMLRLAVAVHSETGMDGDELSQEIDFRLSQVPPGRIDLVAPLYWSV